MPDFIYLPVSDMGVDSDSNESNRTAVNSSQFTLHLKSTDKLNINDEVKNVNMFIKNKNES